jgi:2-polyprenyl-6-methoxyphenol hydroxylase-like FAD-dependent oxidoreductase
MDDRTPFPFALTHDQSLTERLLLRGLDGAGGRVDWGTELRELTPDGEGARALLGRPDGGEEVVRARWVVGADGPTARSATPSGSASPARPTSRRCSWPTSSWRGGWSTAAPTRRSRRAGS